MLPLVTPELDTPDEVPLVIADDDDNVEEPLVLADVVAFRVAISE